MIPFVEFKPIRGHYPKGCNDPEHNPPSMIVLKPGTHIYECPKCGQRQVVQIPEKYM